jgi:hypothetical protein
MADNNPRAAELDESAWMIDLTADKSTRYAQEVETAS